MQKYPIHSDIDSDPHAPGNLIGRVPDSERDRIALLRAADDGPALDELGNALHNDETWRCTPLAALLPRIERLETAGRPFPPLVSTRATTCLMRGRVTAWSSLATRTPAELTGLPRTGTITVEEILKAAVREWATLHLQDSSPANDPVEIYEGLLALSAWGASRSGADDAVTALVAAAESSDELPPQVARALRVLRQVRPSEEDSRQSLERAFVELEASPGFRVFKRRTLVEAADRPTQADLASELGVSGTRAGQLEAAGRGKLQQLMREPTWPIRLAVEQLREILGGVARVQELDEAFSKLDPGSSLRPGGEPHRRRLILFLCDYRLDGEWVLGPDIERLTDVILAAVANGEEPNLDTACRHLTLLGVREEVQLGWILSRVGFRIIDDQIVAARVLYGNEGPMG